MTSVLVWHACYPEVQGPLARIKSDDYIPTYVCRGQPFNLPLPAATLYDYPRNKKKQSDGSAFRLKGTLDC